MHKYHVVDTELLTPTTQLITLKHAQPWKPFSYHPGQYAAISFYHRLRPTPARCFSITSSPNEMDTLQFSMRVKGHFTTAAKSIKIGDTVNVNSSGNYSNTSISLNAGDSVRFVYSAPINDEVVTRFTRVSGGGSISSLTLDHDRTSGTRTFTTAGVWTFKASDHNGNTGTITVK